MASVYSFLLHHYYIRTMASYSNPADGKDYMGAARIIRSPLVSLVLVVSCSYRARLAGGINTVAYYS